MKAYEGYKSYESKVLPEISSGLESMAEGQSPATLFITCSDSRICPNQMTDTKQGELFVIRNAGNTIPHFNRSEGNADAATLEYAIKALKVSEIVVCGHTHCGAVNALIGGVDSKELPVIAGYLKELNNLRELSLSKKLSVEETIQENVKAQITNIKSYDFVQSAIEEGLSIEGWIYDIASGTVDRMEG